MGIGMFYMKTVMGITYGPLEMMNLFWFTLIIPAAQWQLFAVSGCTILLVGLGEEIMYRGIVLHAFLLTRELS